MTRQKSELLRQIQQMEHSIETDTQMGFGYAPPTAFDRAYEEIYKLREQLAHLRHYTDHTAGSVFSVDNESYP